MGVIGPQSHLVIAEACLPVSRHSELIGKAFVNAINDKGCIDQLCRDDLKVHYFHYAYLTLLKTESTLSITSSDKRPFNIPLLPDNTPQLRKDGSCLMPSHNET